MSEFKDGFWGGILWGIALVLVIFFGYIAWFTYSLDHSEHLFYVLTPNVESPRELCEAFEMAYIVPDNPLEFPYCEGRINKAPYRCRITKVKFSYVFSGDCQVKKKFINLEGTE